MKYLDFWDDKAQDILQYMSQEQVFYFVFNSYPNIRQSYYSPFRVDSKPDCYFFYHSNGILLFTDKARGTLGNCFQIFAYKYKLQTFAEIKELLLKLDVDGIQTTYIQPKRVKTQIETKSSEVTEQDLSYWGDYKITLPQLKSDGIRRVWEFMTIKGTRRVHSTHYDNYCYRIYNHGSSKKLYLPFSELKFISNTENDDVAVSCNVKLKSLVITKSYKDWRVLTNQGVNCIWIQSEMAFPSDELLSKIASFFDEIVVFFDNDETGIRQAHALCRRIDLFYPSKAKALYLPESLLKYNISDSSDLVKERNEEELNMFLRQNNVKTYRDISQ